MYLFYTFSSQPPPHYGILRTGLIYIYILTYACIKSIVYYNNIVPRCCRNVVGAVLVFFRHHQVLQLGLTRVHARGGGCRRLLGTLQEHISRDFGHAHPVHVHTQHNHNDHEKQRAPETQREYSFIALLTAADTYRLLFIRDFSHHLL